MRKLLLSLGGFVVAAASYAAPITPEQALSRIGQAGRGAPVSGMPMQNNMELQRTLTASDGMPAVYVFGSDRSQWLIVSADDLAHPLLGRLDTAPVPGEPMPVQLESWLADIADAITEARSRNVSPLRVYDSAPDESDTEGRERVNPLLSTNWGQHAPFNNMCPVLGSDNERALTGCVATAMAQLFAYHRYPEQSTGTGTAMDVTMDLNIRYDYDNMLDNYSDGYNALQASAVSQLMVACGYGAGMDYGLTGSGARDINALNAMKNNFGYSKACYYLSSFFSREEWEDMLYDNVREGYPVYYSGNGREGGHAFVIDGYDRGYFHFNWGWNGVYNGHFLLDYMLPAGDYHRFQCAIVNVVPDDEDYSYEVEPYLYASEIIKSKANEVKISFWNADDEDHVYDIGLIFENVNDKSDRFSVIRRGRLNFPANQGYDKFTIAVNGADVADKITADALYKVVPAYCSEGSQLIPMRYSSSEIVGCFYYNPSDGNEITVPDAPPGATALFMTDVPLSTYASGEESQTTLSVNLTGTLNNFDPNNEINEIIRPVLLRLVDEEDADPYYEIVAEGLVYKAWMAPGEVMDFNMTTNFKASYSNQIPPGHYKLAVLSDNGNRFVSQEYDFEVKAYPGFSALSVKEFGTTAPGNVIPADDMSFDVEFVGGEGIYNRQISVAMWIYSSDGRTLVASLQENIVPSIFPGESYKWHVKFDSDAVRPGMLYIAAVYGFVPTEEENHLNFTAISDPLRGKIGEASGIGDVFADEEVDPDEPVYDLTGRMVAPRFAGAQLAPGIYIVGSRTVLVR